MHNTGFRCYEQAYISFSFLFEGVHCYLLPWGSLGFISQPLFYAQLALEHYLQKYIQVIHTADMVTHLDVRVQNIDYRR